MPVSRICSLSQLIRSRSTSEEKMLLFAERKVLEAEIHQKENHRDTRCKIPGFYLPSLIRIRATDREGNSIEVTY